MTRVPSFIPGTTTHRPAHIASALALATALLTVALAPPPPASPAQAAARATSTGPAPTPTPRGTDVTPPCEVFADRRVDPTTLLLGETVDVTLTVRAICSGPKRAVLLVLVLDGSAAMAGELGHDVNAAALNVVKRLDLADSPHTRVAVVGFDDRVRVVCPLANDAGHAVRCIGRVGASGGSRLDLGLQEAWHLIHEALGDYTHPEEVRSAVAILAAGTDGGCSRSKREARRLLDDGSLVGAVCAGADCDERCIATLPIGPRYYLPWNRRQFIADMLASSLYPHIHEYGRPIVKTLSIVDVIPPDLVILPDTPGPQATHLDVANGRIGWTQTHIPREGVTFTYRVRSHAPGQQPSTLGAMGAFTDGRNRPGSFAFPLTLITVLGFEPSSPR